jgi:hypothetical protein
VAYHNEAFVVLIPRSCVMTLHRKSASRAVEFYRRVSRGNSLPRRYSWGKPCAPRGHHKLHTQ